MTFGNFALDFGVRGRRGNGGGGASSVTFVGAAQAGWASGDGYTFDLTSLSGGSDTSPSDGDCIVWCGTNAPALSGTYLNLPADMEPLGQASSNDAAGTAFSQIACMEAASTTSLSFPSHPVGGVSSVVLVFRGVQAVFPTLDNTATTATATDSGDPPSITHTPSTAGVSIYMGSAALGTGGGGDITDPGNLDDFLAELETSTTYHASVGVGYKIGQSSGLTVDFSIATTSAGWPSTTIGITLAADQGLTENALTITNPGAESGDLTGWVDGVGGWRVIANPLPNGVTPYAGTYSFVGPENTVASSMYQNVDVSAHATDIDAGKAYAQLNWWQGRYDGGSDNGGMWMQFLDGSDSVVGSHFESEPLIIAPSWTERSTGIGAVPTGTRTIRIYMEGERTGGSHIQAYFDEIAASLWVAS